MDSHLNIRDVPRRIEILNLAQNAFILIQGDSDRSKIAGGFLLSGDSLKSPAGSPASIFNILCVRGFNLRERAEVQFRLPEEVHHGQIETLNMRVDKLDAPFHFRVLGGRSTEAYPHYRARSRRRPCRQR